jgi:diguanylate cyclase (GGDEF)-like protein
MTLDGWFIAREPFAEPLFSRSFADVPLFTHYIPENSHGSFVRVVVPDEILRQVTYRILNDYPLVVTVAIAMDNLLASWRYQTEIMVVIGLGISLSILMLFYLLLRNLSLQEKQITTRERNQLLFEDTLLETAPNPVYMKGLDGRFEICNSAFCQLVNTPLDQLLGETYQAVFDENSTKILQQHEEIMLAAAKSQSDTSILLDVILRSSQSLKLRFQLASLTDTTGQVIGVVGALSDMTDEAASQRKLTELVEQLEGSNKELHQQIKERLLTEKKLSDAHIKLQDSNRQLSELASSDGLTGIPNRRHFDSHIESEWQRCLRLQISISLIMFDVDSFKQYNDTYGHPAGDICLQQIASRISQSCSIRRPGDLFARYGGEEFVVVLPGALQLGAKAIAWQIHREIAALAIEHHQSIVDGVEQISISLGVATLTPSAELSIKDLIQSADKALYQAKAEGRNQVVAVSI